MDLLSFAALAYLLPSAIALIRSHHNTFAIFLLNALLGWTAIGWIAALVWAATAVRERSDTGPRDWVKATTGRSRNHKKIRPTE